MTELVRPPFHYIGNKFKRIEQILKHIPEHKTFYDMFGGSGVVGLNVLKTNKCESVVYNEINEYVFALMYHIVHNNSDFIKKVLLEEEKFVNNDSKPDKLKYLELRSRFNLMMRNPNVKEYGIGRIAILYVLISKSFSNDLRFNKHGEFNMPYGERNFLDITRVESLKDIKFGEFLLYKNHYKNIINDVDEDDFVFFDPPYLNTTATYNSIWNESSEYQLLTIIDSLNERGIKFMLTNTIHNRGKTNNILLDWLNNRKYEQIEITGTYSNSSRYKSLHKTTELIIKNF
jgi:DNA adenine methylase Dam